MILSASAVQAVLPSAGSVLRFPSLVLATATLITLLILYALALVVYRLYLSPLASFPGPKLAACTQWYEAYYDLFANGGGVFPFRIKQMHEECGTDLNGKCPQLLLG